MTKINQRAVGARYEQIAGKYLEQQGYEILQYNYRCRQGEIDIIAREGEYLVFCEVKYRSDRRKGMPSEAVNLKKQQVISRCALFYMTSNHIWGCSCRFDVVGILGENGDEIQLYRNAFDYKG